jgi:hypothetical protein
MSLVFDQEWRYVCRSIQMQNNRSSRRDITKGVEQIPSLQGFRKSLKLTIRGHR